MEPERVDLSPLDPSADQLRYERLVRRVLGGASAELARRREGRSPLVLLAGWARPVMAAAAFVGLLAAGVLFATERAGPSARGEPIAEALGVPSPAASWLEEGREPSRSDLVLAMERRP